MLSILPSTNTALLDDLSNNIFGKDFGYQVGFVLYADSRPIGVARLKITPEVSSLVCLGVLPEFRGRGFGDFFSRALIAQMAGVAKIIRVEYFDTYYLKLGFCRRQNGMEVAADKVVFPSQCSAL